MDEVTAQGTAGDLMQFQLVDYVRIAFRHWTLVLVVTSLVLLVAAGVLATRESVYEATTQVLVNTQGRSSVLNDPSIRSDPVRIMETELLLIESRAVLDQVREIFSGAAKVDAETLGEADVIAVRARASDPAHAADIANAHVAAYISLRRTQISDGLTAARDATETSLAEIDETLSQDTARLVQLEATGQGGGAAADRLRGEQDSLIEEQAALQERLHGLELELSTVDAGIDVISPATAPSDQLSPRPKVILVAGALIGLLLGMGAAVIRDRADHRPASVRSGGSR